MKKCSKYVDGLVNKNNPCVVGVIGPTGPAGKDGDKIQIRSTSTCDPNEEAKINDVFINNTHFLDFIIPRGLDGEEGPTGPAGEIGPTGPAGPVNIAFAHKFNDVGVTENLNANVPVTIELNRTGEAINISADPENEITINTNGTYKIDYFFEGSSSLDTALVVGVNLNDESIDGSEISKDVVTNNDTDFHGSVVVKASINDFINIYIKSRKDAVITYAPDTNAYLIVTRLF